MIKLIKRGFEKRNMKRTVLFEIFFAVLCVALV